MQQALFLKSRFYIQLIILFSGTIRVLLALLWGLVSPRGTDLVLNLDFTLIYTGIFFISLIMVILDAIEFKHWQIVLSASAAICLASGIRAFIGIMGLPSIIDIQIRFYLIILIICLLLFLRWKDFNISVRWSSWDGLVIIGACFGGYRSLI